MASEEESAGPTTFEVYIPGEISRQRFGFPRPTTLYVSSFNPGAGLIASTSSLVIGLFAK